MRKSLKIAIFGAVLFAGSLIFGVSSIVVGMMRSFNSIAQSEAVSPEQLADGVTTSLTTTVAVMPVAFIGLCLLVGGLIAHFARRR